MRAVLKKASWGTRRIFGSIRCKKQASTVRKRYSVPKTGSCGTRRIFKGRRTADSTDCGQPPARRTHFQRRAVPKAASAHRTHLQCAKQPPLSLFAPAHSTISFVPLTRNLSPAAPSLAPSTALGTRNGPRSEVSRHKEEADPFWPTSSQKVILIYRRHGRHIVNFVSSFVEKREMLTLTSSLSGER